MHLCTFTVNFWIVVYFSSHPHVRTISHISPHKTKILIHLRYRGLNLFTSRFKMYFNTPLNKKLCKFLLFMYIKYNTYGFSFLKLADVHINMIIQWLALSENRGRYLLCDANDIIVCVFVVPLVTSPRQHMVTIVPVDISESEMKCQRSNIDDKPMNTKCNIHQWKHTQEQYLQKPIKEMNI